MASFEQLDLLFNNTEIDNMTLTEADFQNIGVAVVARLLALNARVK